MNFPKNQFKIKLRIAKYDREEDKMKELTKHAIAQTLNELLESQSIEQITVKRLVEECKINRQTFYYHFCDIYDLIEWSLSQGLSSFLEENPFPDGDWDVKLDHIFKFFLSRKRIILHGYSHDNRKIYERFIIKMIRPIIEEKYNSCEDSDKLPSSKKDFIIKIYVWLFVSLFFEWIENAMSPEYLDMLDDFFVLINGSMEASIQKFIIKNSI